jgi:hypothetical protein
VFPPALGLPLIPMMRTLPTSTHYGKPIPHHGINNLWRTRSCLNTLTLLSPLSKGLCRTSFLTVKHRVGYGLGEPICLKGEIPPPRLGKSNRLPSFWKSRPKAHSFPHEKAGSPGSTKSHVQRE